MDSVAPVALLPFNKGSRTRHPIAALVDDWISSGASAWPKRRGRPHPWETERGVPPGMLERSGVALVDAGEALPGWRRLAALRDEIGLRSPVHSAEKLVDWLGGRRFVVGHTHGPYGARICGALELLEADRAVAVRGIEGSDVLRPGRPIALEAGEPLELPERFDDRLPAVGGAAASAAAALDTLVG
jgi:hypothetical protein